MNRVRKDSKGRRLKTGETEKKKKAGPGYQGYEYRWMERGKRYSVFAPTLEELRNKERHVEKERLFQINHATAQMTLNQCFDKYMELKRGIKDTSRSHSEFTYGMYVRENLGKMKIEEIRYSDVKQFYNYLHDERELSLSSVQRIHSDLTGVFNFAVRDGLILKNPAIPAMKELNREMKDEIKTVHALTESQQVALEAYLKEVSFKDGERIRQWYNLSHTALWTGMRFGEMAALQWEDVDFEKKEIHVRHTISVLYEKGGKTKMVINTPKTRTSARTIPMLPGVEEALKSEKQYQEQKGLFCRQPIGELQNFVFLSEKRTALRGTNYGQQIRRFTQAYNETQKDKENPVLIERCPCHMFRHTFATRLMEQGVSPKTIQQILGHANYMITMNTYVESTNEFTKLSLDSIAEFEKAVSPA